MKIKVRTTGRSPSEAEKFIQDLLDTLGDVDIKHVCVSNLKTFIFYEEKPCDKKKASCTIQSISKEEGATDASSKRVASDRSGMGQTGTPSKREKSK